MSAREEVLRRLRTAARAGAAAGPSDGSSAEPVRHAYRRVGEHPPGSTAVLELLAERLSDYRAEVVRCAGSDDAVRTAVGRALQGRGLRQVVVPDGPAARWAPADALLDPAPDGTGVAVAALDAVDAVVTGCAVAAAETGTLVLDGSPSCGRRVLSLVPDAHVCVVSAEQVVQTLPEALARLEPTRPLTLISGPSATSDIELDRVEGVHGPRTLVVVLAG